MSDYRVQDIKISDQSLANTYINYFVNGQYEDAFNLLENNPQLDSKKFTEDVINYISQYLYNIERTYKRQVPDYLKDLDTGSFGRQQKIFRFRDWGEWNDSRTNYVYDFVTYNNKTYMYKDFYSYSVGSRPTNTRDWELMNLNGEDGAIGLGLTYKRVWQRDMFLYYQYDVVYYDGGLWVAKNLNINQEPSQTASWELLYNFKKANIYVNSTQSSNEYEGLIWFEIL